MKRKLRGHRSRIQILCIWNNRGGTTDCLGLSRRRLGSLYLGKTAIRLYKDEKQQTMLAEIKEAAGKAEEQKKRTKRKGCTGKSWNRK